MFDDHRTTCYVDINVRRSSNFRPPPLPHRRARLGRDVPDRRHRDHARRPLPPDGDPLLRRRARSSSACSHAFEGRKALAHRRPRHRAVRRSARSASPASTCSATSALEHTRPQDAALIVATAPLLTALALWLTTRQEPTQHDARRDGRRAVRRRARDHPRRPVDAAARRRPRRRPAGPRRRRDCWVVYTLGARRFPDFSPLRYTALSAACGTLTILAVDRDRHAHRRRRAARRRRLGARLVADRSTSSSSARWSACWPGTRACAGSAPPTARCSSTSCRS